VPVGTMLLGRNPTKKQIGLVMKKVAPLAERAGTMLLDRGTSKEMLVFMLYPFYRCRELHQRAGERLLEQNPTNDQICLLIRYVESLRSKAGNLLMKRNPRKTDLLCLFHYVKELRNEAGKKLFEGTLTNKDLTVIICYQKDPRADNFQRHAWERLLKQEPSMKDLYNVMENCPSLRMEAWEKYKELFPKGSYLHYILHFIGPLEEVAWEWWILKFGVDNEFLRRHVRVCNSPKIMKLAWIEIKRRAIRSELLYVIHKSNEYCRHEAWSILKKLGPTNDELLSVIEKVESLRDEASLLLCRTNEEIINDMRSVLK